MSGSEHPECGADLEFEGELALARGLVLSGEYSHGAAHAAGCLAVDPTSPAVTELLVDLHGALGELAPDVIEKDPERGYWSGEAALRAWMLRAVGRREEACTLLLQVIGADLERPWAGLLRAWADEDPDLPLPAKAATGCCGSVIAPLLHRAPTDDELRTLVDLTAVLDRCLARHPDDGPLRWAASGVARRAGRGTDAVRWAEEGDRLAPSTVSACMVGYARRSAGDERGAAAAFVEASERAPGDPGPRLDAADSFAHLGEWESASTCASSAWDLDPELGTAAARACYAAWRATGDAAHVLRLVDWVLARSPQPEADTAAALGDAVAFALDGLHESPWVTSIPVPGNAAVDVARQIAEAAESKPEPSGRGAWATVTFSHPEAPSAVLAIEHVVDGPVEIVTTTIPKPDPRVPRRRVKVQSWQLKRGRLVPGVKPPAAPALRAMHVSPTWLYTLADARQDADRLVGSGVSTKDVVALATHPQRGPSAVDAAEWIRRWQVVCCYALARLGAFDVLADLADGPEDWICDAALAGLVELSMLAPGRRDAVLDFAEEHLAESARRLQAMDLPHFGSECDVFVTIPGCSSDLVAAVHDLKSTWRRSYDE